MASSRGQQNRRRKMTWVALGLAMLAGLALVAGGAGEYLSPQGLVTHYATFRAFLDAHWITGLAIYAGIYAVAVALSIPGGLVLTMAGGLFFGVVVGTVATLIAATAGASILFLLARTTLGEALAERAGPRLEALRTGFAEDASSYLLFLRLVPVFPFWLVNLAPALLGVGFWTFVVTTFVGIAPGTFAFTAIGAGLDSVVVEQERALAACRAAAQGPCDVTLDPSDLVTPTLLLALAALGLLALVPVLVKKLWRRRPGHDAGRRHVAPDRLEHHG